MEIKLGDKANRAYWTFSVGHERHNAPLRRMSSRARLDCSAIRAYRNENKSLTVATILLTIVMIITQHCSFRIHDTVKPLLTLTVIWITIFADKMDSYLFFFGIYSNKISKFLPGHVTSYPCRLVTKARGYRTSRELSRREIEKKRDTESMEDERRSRDKKWSYPGRRS